MSFLLNIMYCETFHETTKQIKPTKFLILNLNTFVSAMTDDAQYEFKQDRHIVTLLITRSKTNYVS